MVATHIVRHGGGCDEYNLYESALGDQDSVHGAVLMSSGCVRTSPFPHADVCVCFLVQTQSREEIRYRHTFDAARTIYRSEGPRAFYRGLLPSLLGITHVAVQFPLYEQLKIWARE